MKSKGETFDKHQEFKVKVIEKIGKKILALLYYGVDFLIVK